MNGAFPHSNLLGNLLVLSTSHRPILAILIVLFGFRFFRLLIVLRAIGRGGPFVIIVIAKLLRYFDLFELLRSSHLLLIQSLLSSAPRCPLSTAQGTYEKQFEPVVCLAARDSYLGHRSYALWLDRHHGSARLHADLGARSHHLLYVHGLTSVRTSDGTVLVSVEGESFLCCSCEKLYSSEVRSMCSYAGRILSSDWLQQRNQGSLVFSSELAVLASSLELALVLSFLGSVEGQHCVKVIPGAIRDLIRLNATRVTLKLVQVARVCPVR
jgi:hypothetical protein